MAEEKKDKEIFSKLSKLVIENYDTLQEALDNFHKDIENFFRKLQNKLNKEQYELMGLTKVPFDNLKQHELAKNIDRYFYSTRGTYLCGIRIISGNSKNIYGCIFSIPLLKEGKIKIIKSKDVNLNQIESSEEIKIKNEENEIIPLDEIVDEICKKIQNWDKKE